MTELNFTNKGFLTPDTFIETDLETFEYYFVKSFQTSKTRPLYPAFFMRF
jgi:hypothetical protein